MPERDEIRSEERSNGTVSPRDPALQDTWSRFPALAGITRKTLSLPMIYYVYVLWSESAKKTYIGSCADPDKRLADHNAGRSRWTKTFRPWKRIWLEECPDKKHALKREKYLKSGWGRQWLKKQIT
jgi:putative endonuclease